MKDLKDRRTIFFSVEGVNNLCTVDYYWDYTKDANTSIKFLISHFATYGIPLVMSRRSRTTVQLQRNFANSQESINSSTLPAHRSIPKVMGMSNAVKIAKRLIRKSNRDSTNDLH